jgi:hypothetical protein
MGKTRVWVGVLFSSNGISRGHSLQRGRLAGRRKLGSAVATESRRIRIISVTLRALDGHCRSLFFIGPRIASNREEVN